MGFKFADAKINMRRTEMEKEETHKTLIRDMLQSKTQCISRMCNRLEITQDNVEKSH